MSKFWMRPFLVSALLLLISLSFFGITRWHGIQKMSEVTSVGLQQNSDVIVDLNFPPETFHMSILQNVGRVQKVEGARVYLFNVSYGSLKQLSNYFWVQSIHLWKKD